MSGWIQLLREVKNSPAKLKHHLHSQWPEIFGHEIKAELVQFYRNDSLFTTILSFNHFVEFFTKYSDMKMEVFVTAYTRTGSLAGKGSFTLQSRGVFQKNLSELIPNLDDYGLFSVRMKVTPRYVPDINYMGALSPQLMTAFQPLDGKSTSQMIHSHKTKQGPFVLKRNHTRASSLIELIDDLKSLHSFYINSGGAPLHAGLDILDADTGNLLWQTDFDIAAYGISKVLIPVEELKKKTSAITFRYHYNRSVDHKKPILFRESLNGIYSCNHT
jgi:hypothetical protein